MTNLEIIQTADGSHSLFNAELNETYHSRHGARQESDYVFIRQGLQYVLDKTQQPITVLEVGFGTGLNALLTWTAAELLHRKINYLTLETFPLPATVWKQLNYGNTPEEEKKFAAIHEAGWNEWATLSEIFSLHKKQEAIQQASVPPASIDLIYFDAFAPDKQPGMWTLEVFEKVFGWLKPEGALVTYCAKGQVKRDLRAAGFEVQTLSGPPGKREMIRAMIKPNRISVQ